jgi:hypothetical protein
MGLNQVHQVRLAKKAIEHMKLFKEAQNERGFNAAYRMSQRLLTNLKLDIEENE